MMNYLCCIKNMNDFTKEELKKIHNCIHCTISEHNDDEEGTLIRRIRGD